MKEFNFWCKENTDHGECADKVCDYDNCCCYAHCEECIFYLTDSPSCDNCSVPQHYSTKNDSPQQRKAVFTYWSE